MKVQRRSSLNKNIVKWLRVLKVQLKKVSQGHQLSQFLAMLIMEKQLFLIG